MMNSGSPPALPLHASYIQPTFIRSHNSISLNQSPTKQSSLFRKSPSAKRDSDLSLVDYSTASSSDESEFHYSSESFQNTASTASDEHKFWQVHSSTTIISPPTLASDLSAISMGYVNPRVLREQQKKVQQPRKALPLAMQVRHMLGSTFDEVDEEINQEWDQSRTELSQTLIYLPNISFLSTRS